MYDPSYLGEKDKGMGQEKQNHRDLWLGQDGIERLERLSTNRGTSQSEVARDALLAYELAQSEFRVTVCSAVLDLFRACIPDELYDPREDTRQEDAVRVLGSRISSLPAAEGIQQAFTLLIARNPQLALAIIPERTTNEQAELE